MRLALSAEDARLQQELREFFTTKVPQEIRDAVRNGEDLTKDQIVEAQRALNAGGYAVPNWPVEWGGRGWTPLQRHIWLDEMQTAGVPPPLAFNASMVGPVIATFGSQEQKERFLPATANLDIWWCQGFSEPDAGSDLASLRTTAVRDGDEWVVNGEKTFITGGNEADFAMVFAVTDPEKGADGGVTCFLVDRDAGWTSEPIDTMGERRPASLVFQDVRVPHENILGEEGHGFSLAMKWIGKGRYLLPARALGGCERLLDMAIEYSRTRETFGAPIADRQAIQWMIADSQTEIEALRLLVLHAAWQVSVGRDSRHAQSIAKLFGGVKANEIVDRVMQIHGGMGYTRELPIERFYRDVRLLRIFEGTDEIQRRTIARDLLKGHIKVGATLG